MKVVHAVRSDAFAGVERHVVVLATAQVKAGHEVAVVGGRAAEMTRGLPPEVAWRPATTTAQVAAAVARHRDADLVHAHMTAAEAAVSLVARRGSRIVTTRHFGGVRGTSRAAAAVLPLIRSRVAAQIAISRYVAERVDGPATVVYPGTATPAPASDEGRQPWILAAQRLEPEKRVDLIVEAFARAGVDGWRLVIAGEGSRRAELEALADRRGVAGSVDFLGHRADVGSLLATASLFASACEVEGLGLAVVEAMAAGLPVVAAASGGHLETVGRSDEASLFAPGVVDEAADRFTALMSDADRRRSYGEDLRRVQQAFFTPQLQELGTRAVYERVLG